MALPHAEKVPPKKATSPPPQRCGGAAASRLSSRDILFLIMAFCSTLNVNQVFKIAGIPPLGGVILLVTSLSLMVTTNRPRVSSPLLCYCVTVIAYLGFGAVIGVSPNSGEGLSFFFERWGGSLLVTMACYSYCRDALVRNGPKRAVATSVLVFVLAASYTTFMAPLLPEDVRMKSWDGGVHRFAGVWANPNESAMVCLITIASLLYKIDGVRNLGISAFGALGGLLGLVVALLLTYSKSGMAGMILIFVVYSLKFRRRSLRIASVLIPMGVFVTLVLLWGTVKDQLSSSQIQRVEDVVEILNHGSVSEETSSGRYAAWSDAIEHIRKNPVAGSGLGTSGSEEGNGYKVEGAHNTFLLILGDSGVVPFVALVAFCAITARLLARKVSCRGFVLAICYFMVWIMDVMLTHTALLVKYQSFGMGVLLAYLSLPPDNESRRKRAVVGSVPQQLPVAGIP